LAVVLQADDQLERRRPIDGTIGSVASIKTACGAAVGEAG